MCGPAAIPLIALAVGAAGTGYQAYQTNEQVKGNNKFQSDMAKQGSALASANFVNQATQEGYRQQQADQAAAQTKQENQKQAAKAKATAAVSAGEAGVAGISVDALQHDFNRQEALFNGSVDTNRAWQRAQSAQNIEGFRAGALDRVASLTPNLQSAPGYFGASLRIGGQGLDTYNRYYSPKAGTQAVP